MSGNQVGMIIGGTFGLVFVLVNGAALGTPAGTVVQGLGVAVFVALLVALIRQRGGEAGGRPPQFSRAYWLVVLAEFVAIFAGAQVLGALGLPGLPWVTFVVGVHFLPLARMWRTPPLAWVGGLLAVCGVAGLVVAIAGGSGVAVAFVAGVVPGFVLLAGALSGAVWGARLERSAA